MVHYSVFRFLRDSDRKILIAAAAFYVVGYLNNLKLDIFNPLKGRTVGWNYFLRVIVYMGQNTLVLMCLNGIFYHNINPPLAKWVLDNFGGTAISVTVSGVATTVISLLLCIPFLYLFNRYVPQPPNTRIIFFSLWTFSVNLVISSWGKTSQPAPFFRHWKELLYWGYASTRLKD